jgi:hypothetical protein
MQPQASQVIGHLPSSELVWGEAQEGCEQRPQLGVSETAGQKPKSDESIEQGLGVRVGKAQGGYPLAGHQVWLVDLPKSVFAQKAIMADLLDMQKTSVGLEADLPQGWQIIQPFADVKVAGIVDGGFGT